MSLLNTEEVAVQRYVSGTTIPVSVGTTIMIEAVAGLNGHGASKVVSAIYTIV